MNCPFCLKPVEGPSYHEVLGWERDRKQGGTNALRLRERTGKQAHQWCVDRAVEGRTGQQELWSG